MTHTEYAVLLIPTGILSLGLATLWQTHIMLSETYTLNRFQNDSRKMLWIAVSLFFSFSLSVYCFCPNARKKGILFFLLGGAGVVCYGLGMWYKNHP